LLEPANRTELGVQRDLEGIKDSTSDFIFFHESSFASIQGEDIGTE